ncbi:uncharacterized protein DS421_19g668520 [Arachis hypogaea]|uniref:Uncharacterized protein n=1 Tax=Arachis hypogaea TaxID=3818 RepID=A0A6B9VEZ6_ARAHY|nr:uncharacterized protein DS421_19g668520 [Arachis hypogaea]
MKGGVGLAYGEERCFTSLWDQMKLKSDPASCVPQNGRSELRVLKRTVCVVAGRTGVAQRFLPERWIAPNIAPHSPSELSLSPFTLNFTFTLLHFSIL